MKRKLFLVLFFFSVFYAGAQNPHMRSNKLEERFAPPQQNKPILTKQFNSLIQVNDSIYQWWWDALTNGWEVNPFRKIVNMIYDADYNLMSEIWQSWSGSAWDNEFLHTFSYDANNNQTSRLYQIWNGSAWDNYLLLSYTYDANNNLTSVLNQEWITSAWENSLRYTFTYNINNYLTSRLAQNWFGSAWVNSNYLTFTYDTNNNLASYLQQNWNGSAWENNFLHTSTYDANNNETNFLRQSWNGSAWVNNFLHTNTYDANNNQTSSLSQTWNGSAWDNFNLTTYINDANGNNISQLEQYWNGSGWTNDYVLTYTFDMDDFMQSSAFKHFDLTGTIIEWGDSAHYYFHTAVGINNLQASNNNSITIFPNPTSGTFTIEVGMLKQVHHDISVYDVLGEKVFTQTITSQKTQINLSHQPNGIYFVRVKSDGHHYTRRVSVMR